MRKMSVLFPPQRKGASYLSNEGVGLEQESQGLANTAWTTLSTLPKI